MRSGIAQYNDVPGRATMIIPIGTRVLIADCPGVYPKCIRSCEAIIVGYEREPPKMTSRLRLERPGNVATEYALLFPWLVEVMDEMS